MKKLIPLLFLLCGCAHTKIQCDKEPIARQDHGFGVYACRTLTKQGKTWEEHYKYLTFLECEIESNCVEPERTRCEE